MNIIETTKKVHKCEKDTVIIFITDVKEYVFEVFDMSVFYYLIKPVNNENIYLTNGDNSTLIRKKYKVNFIKN